MTSVTDIDRVLDQRYRTLADERDGHPVYGVEHGLNEADMRILASGLSASVEQRGIDRADGLFAFIALASEVGYVYEGFSSGYWPRLEALLRCALTAQDRETLSAFFEEANESVGIARPDDTPFTRTFRHIAWPLANALAPRQIHAGLSEALFAATIFDPDDASFVRLVRQGCLRSGAPRLIEWSENQARVEAVATALLGQPDGRLSARIVERLAIDAMTSPVVRDQLVRAKAERGRRRRSSPVPDVTSATPEREAEPGYSTFGGLLLGVRRYACGVPLGIRCDSLPLCAALREEGRPEDRSTLAPGEAVVFEPDRPAELVLEYTDQSGVRRTAVLRFEAAEPLAPLISMSVQPVGGTLTDLREGRFSLILNIAQDEYAEKISAPRNLVLKDVPVTLALSVPGWPTAYANTRIPRVPGRLGATSDCLQTLREELERMYTGTGLPSTARLSVDLGVSNWTLTLADPEPTLRWFEMDGGWKAVPVGSREDETLPEVLAVPASDPFAEARAPQALGQRETLLLRVADGFPESAIVDGPRTRHGFSSRNTGPPAVHRRLKRSQHGPGLLTEIEAWLYWNCARPIHTLAAMEARNAVRAAEQAVVTTLCGEDWLAEEANHRSGAFASLLAYAAIHADAVKSKELSDCGATIDKQDMSELHDTLAKVFEERCRALLAVPDATQMSDETAARLDEAVDHSWTSLTERRAARGLEPIDPDTGNDTGTWRELWDRALGMLERRGLAAMILPPRLADELRDTSFATADPTAVARVLVQHRLDLGLLSRTSRRMGGDDILSALTLWTAPRAFARLNWLRLAVVLLEDRMTTRAVRYAALRMRQETGAAL